MKIPENEQDNVMSSFWQMLRECESTASRNNDPVLKHWVNHWYLQYSKIAGKEYKPTQWEQKGSSE